MAGGCRSDLGCRSRDAPSTFPHTFSFFSNCAGPLSHREERERTETTPVAKHQARS